MECASLLINELEGSEVFCRCRRWSFFADAETISKLNHTNANFANFYVALLYYYMARHYSLCKCGNVYRCKGIVDRRFEKIIMHMIINAYNYYTGMKVLLAY